MLHLLQMGSFKVPTTLSYDTPFRSSPTDSKTESFTPSIFPSSKNLFILRNFNRDLTVTPSGTQTILLAHEGRKHLIGSSSLNSIPPNHADIPTHLHHFSGNRYSPGIFFTPPPAPSLAPGRCFRTWVLITYQFC